MVDSSKMLPPSAQAVAFGSKSPCNLDNCPVEWSLYTYRPSLAANAALLALFAIIGFMHVGVGVRWKQWGFMGGMIAGCLSEVIGYAGRIMLWNNPFDYTGFIVQIVCLTIAPVFYTASIYVTLSKTIMVLAPEISRFKPQLFYYIFIPFDIVCLILQSAGGAMSASGSGNAMGVDISMAGLVLQIVVLVLFIAAFADYMIRYVRSDRAQRFTWRQHAFFYGLSAATLLIFARCIYRVIELKDGYHGEMIKHEIPFVVLEGAVIVLAAVALLFGHPGLILGRGLEQAGADAEKAKSTSEISLSAWGDGNA